MSLLSFKTRLRFQGMILDICDRIITVTITFSDLTGIHHFCNLFRMSINMNNQMLNY